MSKYKHLMAAFVLIVAAFLLNYLVDTCKGDDTLPPAKQYHKVEWAWTSSAGGFWQSGTSKQVTGFLIGAKFKPSTSAVPTALYDVTVLNADGMDVLNSTGLNLPSGVTDPANMRSPMTDDGGYPYLWQETVAPKVENAGAAKSGTVILYMKP